MVLAALPLVAGAAESGDKEKEASKPGVTITRNVDCASLKVHQGLFGKPQVTISKRIGGGEVSARINPTNLDEFVSTVTFNPQGMPGDVIVEVEWVAKLVWDRRVNPIRTERRGTFVWFGPKNTPVVLQYIHGPYYVLGSIDFTRMACHKIEPDPCPEDDEKPLSAAVPRKKPPALPAENAAPKAEKPLPPGSISILPGEFD